MRAMLAACAVLVPALGFGLEPRDSTAPLTGDRTMVAWVAPGSLDQRGAGPLGMDSLGDFDSIVFGEIAPGRWMAGSDWFKRTERNQEAWPAETAGPDTVVQIAVVYQGKQISLYRDGKPYASYETAGESMPFGVGGVVTIGLHRFDLGGRHFAGRVSDARIYDVALSAEQVAALEPKKPSTPAPWAWWNFENGGIEDVTGRFESLTFGDPKVVGGRLELDGVDDAVIGVRGAAEPGLPKTPPAPTQYAYVFSAGYGQGNFYPTDPAEFEKLVVNLREGGFNTIHCTYRPEYVEICRKHGMKIMLDVLAWKEPVEQDVRRALQQERVLEICRKVRGDDTIWGYNLWNERLDRYAPGGNGGLNGAILALRTWDPTHPVWVGTYMTWWRADWTRFNPGCLAYYDYHWERGLKFHFRHLPAFMRISQEQDMYFGRWMRNLDVNRSAYTMNTSIAFGMKTGMWFICGPWHPAQPERWNADDCLCQIGRAHQRLWPEIGKIGRPLAVYSTPTTKLMDGTDKPAGIPVGAAIPPEYPLQVTGGEALLGHFRYADGTDALYVANHNAFAPQAMVIGLKDKALTLEIFDRQTGEWKALEPRQDGVGFDLASGGGELLRIKGGRLP